MPRSLPTFSPCNVAALDEPGAGGAHHLYAVQALGPVVVSLQFQHGPRAEGGSTIGIFDDDLLAIVQDRLIAFQAGPFSCDANAHALDAVMIAREALSERVVDRMARGVLGKNTK